MHIYQCFCMLSTKQMRRAWGILSHSSLKTIFNLCVIWREFCLWAICPMSTSQACSKEFRSGEYADNVIRLVSSPDSVSDISAVNIRARIVIHEQELWINCTTEKTKWPRKFSVQYRYECHCIYFKDVKFFFFFILHDICLQDNFSA